MGIKFLCPNGHKLHVKSFLAGKRAICPRCGARVIVPPESSAPDAGTTSTTSIELSTLPEEIRAAVTKPLDSAAPAAAPPETAPTNPPTAPPPTANPNPAPAETGSPVSTGAVAVGGQAVPADPIASAPGAVWYVRPASGGQYGPASGEILRGWIDGGRVGAGSLVWCAGWEQWRGAAEVFPELKGGADVAVQPLPPAAENSASPVPPRVRPVEMLPPDPEPAAGSTSTALPQLMRKKRRRNEVSLMASGVLAVVSLILVIVLLLVFRYQSAPVPTDNAEAPKADAPAE